MPLPIKHTIRLTQGATTRYVMQWIRTITDYADLTNWYARMSVRDASDDSLLVTWGEKDDSLAVYASVGAIMLTLIATDADVPNLVDVSAVYDLELVKISAFTAITLGADLVIDVDNSGGLGHIRVGAGTPFSSLVAGDFVRITAAENGENNARFREVSSLVGGGAGVVLVENLNGTDNAADSTAVVSTASFDHTQVIQLLRGKLKVLENRTLGTDI